MERKLGIYKNRLDFDVLDTKDPKYIFIIDTSDYMDENPDFPLYEILPPGYKDAILIPGKPHELNVINTVHLELSDCVGNLPDGLYHINYSVRPKEQFCVSKFYLRNVTLKNQIGKYALKADDCDIPDEKRKQRVNNLQDLNIYVQGMEAAIELCDEKKAMLLYQQAKALITKLHKDEC